MSSEVYDDGMTSSNELAETRVYISLRMDVLSCAGNANVCVTEYTDSSYYGARFVKFIIFRLILKLYRIRCT